jgi:protein TonB
VGLILAAAGLNVNASSPEQTPLTGQLQQLTGAVAHMQPGPLEIHAKPVGRENPIPRRLYFVSPQYPAEAAPLDATATIRFRLTIDALGHVAEARPIGSTLASSDAFPPPGSPPMGAILESFASAVDVAVHQWIYEAPADAPIWFDVLIRFTRDADAEVSVDTRAVIPTGDPADSTPRNDSLPINEPRPAWAEDAVPVSDLLQMPVKVRHVAPAYPDAAREAGITGVIIVEARIEPDGTVRHARVVRSISALDQAALDAILQWEYTPTLMNGVAVPVRMTVTVQFSR